MIKKIKPEVGAKIKIIKNTNNHNYTIGETYVLHVKNGALGWNAHNLNKTFFGNILLPSDFKILNNSKEDFEEQIKDLKAKIAEISEKLEYLKISGADDFDPAEFKAFKTLKILENSSLSQYEKAKIIANLIKD